MSEISLKRVCCMCLSTDRKLSQLCRIADGVNLLYMLLTHDPEAYKEGFYKDTAGLFACWECAAIMHRIRRFQAQACIVQRELTSIADGRNDAKLQTFSNLTATHNSSYHYVFQFDTIEENFVDCGPTKDIKTESDSDDLPLSVFYFDNDSDCDPVKDNFEPANNDFKPDNGNAALSKITQTAKLSMSRLNKPGNVDTVIELEPGNGIEPKKEELSRKKTKMKYSKYFTVCTMNEDELNESIELRKMHIKESVFKCDSCVLHFETKNELFEHNADLHEKKDNCDESEISHTHTEDLHTHKGSHHRRYNCILCTNTEYTHFEIVRHLKTIHKDICCAKKKGSKTKVNKLSIEELNKYPCPECGSSFTNKDLRWKHIQKAHREGYKCSTCDKRFAFKNNLQRHERIHTGPLPREECPTCHKMIRSDLMTVHSRIHTDRLTHTCIECDKTFVSRATYESHLKYTRRHAQMDVCKHKCPSCHKRYRSRGELRDHINYQHNGRAEHKCPICGKGLATKRCIRRHVRRTHEGIKESAKDKICQQCGKAFRDKKGLTEHERVHSGARPLSCAQCGRAFRQRAALYAHTNRVHRKQ